MKWEMLHSWAVRNGYPQSLEYLSITTGQDLSTGDNGKIIQKL
jgi:hypothetical protein